MREENEWSIWARRSSRHSLTTNAVESRLGKDDVDITYSNQRRRRSRSERGGGRRNRIGHAHTPLLRTKPQRSSRWIADGKDPRQQPYVSQCRLRKFNFKSATCDCLSTPLDRNQLIMNWSMVDRASSRVTLLNPRTDFVEELKSHSCRPR